jgi:hypothetical protein
LNDTEALQIDLCQPSSFCCRARNHYDSGLTKLKDVVGSYDDSGSNEPRLASCGRAKVNLKDFTGTHH